MSYPISKIDGLGPQSAAKLKAVGIRTTDGLLRSAGSAKARKILAAKTGIGEQQLLEWANIAAIMSVKGISTGKAGLIRASGYVFAIDENQGHNFTRRPDKRSRILSLNDGSLIVNVIPLLVNIESVVYEHHNGSLRVTDGKWAMDIKEFGLV